MTDDLIKPQPEAPRKGINVVSALHILKAGQEVVEELCQIVEEDALTLDIEGIGKYILMWTPTEDIEGAIGFTDVDGVLGKSENPEALALAAGFVFTEGIIESLDNIRTMAVCSDDSAVVQMILHNINEVQVMRKDVVISSSCSICGKQDVIDNNVYQLNDVSHKMLISSEDISDLMGKMAQDQDIFQHTGGSHAAAIFTDNGEIWSVAEDLGRHNALDKVIGRRLLEVNSFDHCGILLSSRLSMEMLVKVIRAGFEIVAAISAPTSLAVELAERFGVTLCGFVRRERLTVYTHPERIKLANPAVHESKQ